MITLDRPWQPVVFGADPAAETIRVSGLLFECGAYPEKGFTFSEADADRAVAAFTPTWGDYEHRPGPLDRKLGQLVSMWREGNKLWGTAEVPRWVHGALADAGQRISMAFDPVTKTVVGWGWTTHPHISEAALTAQFHAYADTAEETTMDSVRQWWASMPGQMRTALDGTTGADTGPNPVPVVPLPASPSAPAPSPAPAPTPTTVPTPQPQVPPVAAFSATDELTQMRARLAQVESERRAERAVALTERLVLENKILPAQVAFARALYSQALADDSAQPVTFSAEEGGARFTRASLVQHVLDGLTQHTLTEDQLEGTTVLGPTFSTHKDQDATDPRTPAGAEQFARTWAQKRNGPTADRK